MCITLIFCGAITILNTTVLLCNPLEENKPILIGIRIYFNIKLNKHLKAYHQQQQKLTSNK